MQIFNSGLFWFIEGILFVVVIMAVRAMLEDRGFTIAFVGTSYGEGEPVAAVRGGLLFGLITVIAGAGVWRLLLSGKRSGGGEAELGA